MTLRILIAGRVLWMPKWLVEEIQGQAVPLWNGENAFVLTNICQQAPSVLNCLLKICIKTKLINTMFRQMHWDATPLHFISHSSVMVSGKFGSFFFLHVKLLFQKHLWLNIDKDMCLLFLSSPPPTAPLAFAKSHSMAVASCQLWTGYTHADPEDARTHTHVAHMHTHTCTHALTEHPYRRLFCMLLPWLTGLLSHNRFGSCYQNHQQPPISSSPLQLNSPLFLPFSLCRFLLRFYYSICPPSSYLHRSYWPPVTRLPHPLTSQATSAPSFLPFRRTLLIS